MRPRSARMPAWALIIRTLRTGRKHLGLISVASGRWGRTQANLMLELCGRLTNYFAILLPKVNSQKFCKGHQRDHSTNAECLEEVSTQWFEETSSHLAIHV